MRRLSRNKKHNGSNYICWESNINFCLMYEYGMSNFRSSEMLQNYELVRFEVGDVIRMPANNQNQGKEYCRQLWFRFEKLPTWKWKWCILRNFPHVFDIANQLFTRHSPFAPLGQVRHSQSMVVCRNFLALWLLNPDRSQRVTFEIS